MPLRRNTHRAIERLVTRDAPRIGPAVLAASVAINVLALAMPLVLLQVFDRVIPYRAHETLQVLFIGLCAVLVFDLAFKLCRVVLLGLEGQDYELALGQRVLRHILSAEPAAHERNSIGVHFDRLGAVATLRDFYSGQARLLNIDLPFTVIFVWMILLIGGWLVLVPAGCFVLLFAFRRVLKGIQSPVLERRKTVDERRHSFLVEFLSQIVTVKSQSMEPQMLRRYEMLQDQSVDASRSLTGVTQFSQAFGAVFSQGAVAAMGLFGSYLVIRGSIGVAEMAACMLLNGRTIQPMLKMLGLWVQSEAVETSRTKLRELFATPKCEIPDPRMATFEGHVVLRDVGIVRRGGGHLFRGIEADVAAGGCLAISGPDGAGKTTLLRLLLGEETPDEGRVLIDGRTARVLRGARGRGGIAYVDSNPMIFEGSILDNIALFGDAAAAADAMDVAREIGLEDDVHRLPDGYDTPIGAGQTAASRGFVQRICIARALALRPKVLLFNEANTALDHGADAAVLDAMRRLRGRTTLVLVSRRPSWLALGDVHIDLAEVAGRAATLRRWADDRNEDTLAAEDDRRTA